MAIFSFARRRLALGIIVAGYLTSQLGPTNATAQHRSNRTELALAGDQGLEPVDKQWISRWTQALSKEGREFVVNTEDAERRVLFDPDKFWTTSESAAIEVVSQAKRAGFNVLVVPLWQGAGTRYPSAHAPWSRVVEKDLSDGRDPFARLLNEAHDQGLEVHAWFNVVQRRRDFMGAFYNELTPRRAFDVHNKQFRDFIVGLIAEVVDKYAVDGVNLDHIRSMGLCKSSFCIDDYARQTGGSLEADALLGKLPGPARDRIRAWNYRAVTDIVSRVSALLRAREVPIPLSVDAHPNDPRLLWQGQDSVRWANDGLVDVIFDMRYHKHTEYDEVLDVLKTLEEPARLTILQSTYAIRDPLYTPWSAALVESYVRLDRLLLPNGGIAFYHRKRLSPAQITQLRHGPWQHDVATSWPMAKP